MKLDEHLARIPDGGPLELEAQLASVRRRAQQRRRRLVTAAAIVAVMAIVGGTVWWTGDTDRRATTDRGSGARERTDGRILSTRLIKADVTRVTDPKPGSHLVPAVVAADTSFGLHLLDQLAPGPDGNVFFSPYSIAAALTMTYAGARGESATQLARVLGLGSLGKRVHEGRNALDLLLSAPRPLPPNPPSFPAPSGQALSLATVNALWGQAGFSFRRPFLETLARRYGAGMNTVDFEHAAEDARLTINAWVARHTNDRITKLLPSGILDEFTRLVLVNTISFKASWASPFDPKATSPGAFTRADGSKVTVEMMSLADRPGEGRSFRTRYTHTNGWQAVRLPYLGNASMTVLLPDRAGATLDAATWASIQRRRDDAIVTLTMPKFAYTARASLQPALRRLGLRDLFETSADLSGMDGHKDLFIKAVEHQAAVSVDERGTQAVASTAAVGELVSRPPSVTVALDRPFTFVVQDDATGEMLFVGRVADPTAR